MDYLTFLKALLALGPKLPQIMALVQHIVADVQEILVLVRPEQVFTASDVSMELNKTEQRMEDEVLVAMEGSGNETFAGGDRGVLRSLFDFIKQNPELLKLIIALLAK